MEVDLVILVCNAVDLFPYSKHQGSGATLLGCHDIHYCSNISFTLNMYEKPQNENIFISLKLSSIYPKYNT